MAKRPANHIIVGLDSIIIIIIRPGGIVHIARSCRNRRPVLLRLKIPATTKKTVRLNHGQCRIRPNDKPKTSELPSPRRPPMTASLCLAVVTAEGQKVIICCHSDNFLSPVVGVIQLHVFSCVCVMTLEFRG